MDTDEIWSSITLRAGSVQHLDLLSTQEKAVYKTAFELDQRWIIEHAADRAPFICQSQSVNVFLPANVHKRDLHQIHFMAWKRGQIALLLPESVDPACRQCERGGGAAGEFTDVAAAIVPANDETGAAAAGGGRDRGDGL